MINHYKLNLQPAEDVVDSVSSSDEVSESAPLANDEAEDEDEDDDDDEEDDDEDDDDDEDEAEDQFDVLRKECAQTKDCSHYVHHYQSCVERVTKEMEEEDYATKDYKEDCVEEFFHLQHCINECAAPKLFSKLK
ncbi:unnamed protein product [Ambrosiozyma monospora]|uniref:Cytochrome b-c1 complex subunit 6, mitochondrial n=1 Tax=Ambrosiozyma monospora TaxID=43982 RepID=A0A9W7DIV7_AMBMO|nr:unnamed protein product [Ambrosiozyma monospora]